MTTTFALWLVAGGIVALVMMLVVVVVARGLERRSLRSSKPLTTTAHGTTLAASAVASAAALTAINPALGILARMAARRARYAGTPARKRIGIAVSGASLAIVIAVVTGLAKDRENREPPMPVEITAGALHGTLLSPKKSAPLVLIVPGSGPTDRDGNSPLGVKAGMYKQLAEALSKKGIASVRVDKRGMFGSAGAGDPNITSIDAYVQDYHAWIDAIRAETGRKCVWLLGHSEGALMVSAAAEGRKDVCGLILVSGMGRKMGDVLRQQLQSNPANAPILDQAFAAIADLEAGRHPDTTGMHPALAPLFAPQVQDFLISMFATDPVEAVRHAHVKTLIVQGTNDLQVTVEDAKLLNHAPRTRLELIKGMNHVLKEAPEDRAGNIATYANPDLPIHPKLARKIADFIKGDD